VDAAGGGRQIAAEQVREQAFAHAVAPDQAGRGAVERGGQFGKQDPAVGQGMRHAIEREGECGHATSMDAKDSPPAGQAGGDRPSDDGGINGACRPTSATKAAGCRAASIKPPGGRAMNAACSAADPGHLIAMIRRACPGRK